VLGVTRSPKLLLVLTTWLSGVLSALVVNDTLSPGARGCP
jgi:hypothetical protein